MVGSLLERDVIAAGGAEAAVIGRRRFGEALVGLGSVLAATGWSLAATASAATSATTASAATSADELEVLYDNTQLAALIAALVFPLGVLQATFDQYGTALLHVLVEGFGLLSVGAAVDKAGFFPLLTVAGSESAIDRQPKLNDRRL